LPVTTILTELPPVTLLLLVSTAIIAGILIGSVGIGGILVVPALVYIAGIDIYIAIASCMFSYAFSGLIGTWLYAKKGSIRWSSGLYLCAGAIAGAWLGATLLNQLATDWVILIIALFVLFAAYSSIRQSNNSNRQTSNSLSMRFDKPLPLLAVGILTGAGSALSGSGGPLLLIPTLVWLKWPVLTAVGLGQLIQIPISLSADIANFQAGTIDLPLAVTIAIAMATGVAAGARFAHRLPATVLRNGVIAALILAAVWMLIHSVTGMV